MRIRGLEEGELDRLWSLDRAEAGERVYRWDGTRLVLEAREVLRRHRRGLQHLDRHTSARTLLLGLEDEPHAATPQPAQDAVLADPGRIVLGS